MNNNEIILYQPDGSISLEVRVENETIWLTQKQMAQLYGTAVPAISKHIKNIFDSGELQAEATVSKMEIVQKEGNRSISRATSIYNLDMIIAVGYRVNSHQATTFRIWATKVLKEYLYRGFAMLQMYLPESSRGRSRQCWQPIWPNTTDNTHLSLLKNLPATTTASW